MSSLFFFPFFNKQLLCFCVRAAAAIFLILSDFTPCRLGSGRWLAKADRWVPLGALRGPTRHGEGARFAESTVLAARRAPRPSANVRRSSGTARHLVPPIIGLLGWSFLFACKWSLPAGKSICHVSRKKCAHRSGSAGRFFLFCCGLR